MTDPTGSTQPGGYNGTVDGHAMTVTFFDQAIEAQITCPYAGQDLTAIPWHERPACRQPYTDQTDEDFQPVPDLAADPGVCLVIRDWDYDGTECLDTGETTITATCHPVPIGYWWDTDTEPYLRVRPLTGH